MKNNKNKEMIQEFFFKKKKTSMSDKIKEKFPYEPMDARKDEQLGFGSLLSTVDGGLAVTDAKEAGKRVVSALGASLGVNSIKNIASRSIKSFPIVVSENVEPETSVMLKKVLEEQYAEYISLLISNQTIDISAFKTGEEEGNIAIQALDTIAADEESFQSKLAKGKVSPDELLGSLTAYNLIRNESKQYKTNNALLDSLLEGSFIVPSTEASSLLEFYGRFFNEIVLLEDNEREKRDKEKDSESKSEKKSDDRFVDLDTFLTKDLKLSAKISDRKGVFDALRGKEADEEDEEETEEHKNWNAQVESVDERIEEVEEELETLRGALIRPLTDDTLESQIRTQEGRLEDRVRSRATLLTRGTPAPTTMELQVIDLDIAAIRDRISRLEAMRVSPNSIRSSIASAERELKGLRAEKNVLVRTEPRKTLKKEEKFSRLSTPRVLLDREQLNKSLNSSIAEILLAPTNKLLRDKFERATFLLESNRIAGTEYIEYLVQRLGIPVAKDIRGYLATNFKISDIIDTQRDNNLISRADVKRIKSNQLLTKKVFPSILKATGKMLLTTALIGGLTASALGAKELAAGTAALWTTGTKFITDTLAGSSLAGLLGIPAFASIILGSAVGIGAAAIAGISMAIWKARKIKAQKQRKIQGWERVESLILAMEEQQNSLKQIQVVDNPENREELTFLTKKDMDEVMSDYNAYMGKVLEANKRPAITNSRLSEDYLPELDISPETYQELLEAANILIEGITSDRDHQAILTEHELFESGKISSTTPFEVVPKFEYDPGKNPEVLVTPKFSTSSQYAYGGVEYDKRELKDRRYNAPLLMTVKFKERFSDGTFSDNELTAVIGILGVITRVPSEEMEYILKSNAEGDTVRGILSPEGDPAALVSDLLGVEKIKKDVKNLPMSGDIWQNLEKISRLAVSNKLSGKKTNNIANAHIIFAQKEIDNVRANEGIDYVKNIKLVSSLLKRYSAFTIMIANDISERVYIFDDLQAANWDVVPYSAMRNKDTGEQLNSMLNKMSSGRL
jgi:hypothetical protein